MNPFDYNNKPTDDMIANMNIVRTKCKELWDFINQVDGVHHYKVLAKNHLEEVSLWTNKAISHKVD